MRQCPQLRVAGSWKKCKRGEGEEEIWGFLEEGGKQFGKKNVEAGELAGERSCQGIRKRPDLYS